MARHGENIRKRNDGRWEARLMVGRLATGDACYKSFYGSSYAEVKAKRAKYVQEMEELTPALLCDRRFSQLLDDWLFFIRIEVKETTFSKYKHDIEKHIRKELGNYKTADISTELLDRYTREKLNSGRSDGKGGLSAKTVSGLLSIIKQVLDFGRDRGYECRRNVSIHNPRQYLPDIQVLTREEQLRMERAIRDDFTRIHAAILVALYSGLRIGEVCALKWEDICLKEGVLVVQHTMKRIQNTEETCESRTKVVIGSPKTDRSRRTVPLPEFLIHVIRELECAGNHYFLTGTDQYMEPRGFYRKYRKFMQPLGLGQYNFHALRHTFATRCVEMGMDAKSLSEMLGHSDVSITLRRYVHSSLDLKRKQIELLACHSIYGQTNGQKSHTFR